MHALGSYTFQDVSAKPAHDRLSNSPRHLVRARVTGPIVPRLVFYGLEALYTGDRLTLDDGVAAGTVLTNLTITSRELSRLKLSLTVGNLFDRAYADPGAEEHPSDVIPQDGRIMRVRVAWRF